MEQFRSKGKKIIHYTLRTLGVVFLFAGLLGLVFPIIPGIPLLILSILILGEESIFTSWIVKRLPESAREKIRKLKKRF